MALQTDAKYLFDSLESTDLEKAKEIKSLFHENLSANPRDTWLVYGLVDYYLNTNSTRCIEILIEVREPHDKHVFDRLSDCVKSSPTRMAALCLLGQIVCKHPSWIYKISSHSLFSVLLKLLKSDNDIPTLLSAVLILINLLPMIPALISTYLVTIFEIFLRLASWNLQKTSNIPEIYVTHLHVGVYALFHRLYGMYPCNFLSHLRAHYGDRVNLSVFSETIRPMLERVRMHPLLVTASRDNELSLTRWKNLTMHDIIMECAKVSLDVIEGIQHDSGPSYIYQTVPPSTDDSTVQAAVTSDKLCFKDKLPNKPISESFASAALCEAKQLPGAASPMYFTYSVKDFTAAADSLLPESQPSSPLRKFVTNVKFSPANEDSYVRKEMSIRPSQAACRALTFSDDSVESVTDKLTQSLTKSTESDDNQQSLDDDKYDVDKEVSDIVDRGIARSKAGGTGLEDSGKEEQVPERLYQRSDSVIHDEAEGIQAVELEDCPDNSISKVVELVRKVNRLRYYSHCGPPPEIVEPSPVQPTIQRSYSCPHLSDSPSPASTPSGTEISPSSSRVASPQKISPEKKSTVMGEGSYEGPVKETRVPLIRTDPEETKTTQYHQMLVHALPPIASSCYFRCKHCKEQGAVLFELSASECLHKHLMLNYDIHKSSHYYGVEEMSGARGQIMMLYNQLLFERYRRSVFGERNRNLLAKLKKARAFEEQNFAMKDQLKLQEKAIQDHNSNSSRLVLEQSQVLSEKSQTMADLSLQNRKIGVENERLKFENEELATSLEKKEMEVLDLRKDWQRSSSQLRNATLELEDMRVKLADNVKLQIEVDRLQKEVVLMGELQQKYRERFSSLTHPSAVKLETTYALESCKNELRATKRMLDLRNQQVEAYKSRVAELESQLSKKEVAMNEQKKLLQKTQEEYEERVQCLETHIGHSSKMMNQVFAYRVLEGTDPPTPEKLPIPETTSYLSQGRTIAMATTSRDDTDTTQSSSEDPHGSSAAFDHVRDPETREYLKRHFDLRGIK